MIKKFFFILAAIVFTKNAIAMDLTHWQIQPDKSTMTFTAIQNGAPVVGKFTRFSGMIQFDPKQLNQSNAKINIDMNALTADYDQVISTLKTPEWFNIKLFPIATCVMNQFTKINKNEYMGNGTLTIKNKTIPITIHFILEEYTNTQAHATGDAIVKRTSFSIGEGEWANTDVIKDDVKIHFDIFAIPEKHS